MQPLPWIDLWPADPAALFVPRLVISAAAIFVIGGWLGRRAGHPVAAKIIAGSWMAAATLALAWRLGIPLDETALVPRSVLLSLVLALGLGAAVAPVVILAVRLPEMRRFYPELRSPVVAAGGSSAVRARLAMIGAWLVYLVGYEALFRGLLLPLFTREFGLWPGIAVTTGLYVLAHLDRPTAESLAAIPAGFVMAAITLVTGSFLASLLLHWIISTINETSAAAIAFDAHSHM
jgi:membrane protease YdiL (CAAX protease family)